MGLLNWLGFGRQNELLHASQALDTTRSVVSPWAGDNHLTRVTLDELFPGRIAPVTRAEAMSIGAVAKARHLLCEMPARQPLVAYRDGLPLEIQPTWLSATNSQVAPRTRTLWLLDDLLFYGWALLLLERGAAGQVLDASRIAPQFWRFNTTGQVEVSDVAGNWRVAQASEVVLIPGVSEGLLENAARTIRGARNLEDAWQARVNVPLPTTEIRYTGEEDLTQEEMLSIRTTYIAARRDVDGAVMVTPRGFEIHTHAQDGFDLFEQGRNAAVLDISRFTNLPAQMLDSSNVNASSVNYTNGDVNRNLLFDVSLRSFILTLEDRLSMDDVTPRGTYIQFDLSNLTNVDTGSGPTLED